MKFVIDTNVMLVSVSSRSPYHWIFQPFAARQHELCVTTDILLEYQEKIAEHMGEETANAVIAAIVEWPNLVRVNTWYNFNLIKKDPDDNKFVDCSIATGAYCIISEDNDFKILETIDFPKVRVIKIAELKELLNA